MAKDDPDKPFGGAISRFAEKDAPEAVRAALKGAGKDDILDPRYPYRSRIPKAEYEAEYETCQRDLVRAHERLRAGGGRLVVVFEGRDAAGKGGSIKAVTENMNPRHAKVAALPAPTEAERGQWYFQRYAAHLPTSGQIVLFDRSWYNRAVVEPVMGFCTQAETERFLEQAPEFERMLTQDGIVLMKIWLAIGRAEQLRQFLQRESDPLKHWKLSQVDVDGLARWDDYSAAIREMFARTHSPELPWTVIWSEDKRRARLNVMRAILARIDAPGRRSPAPDPKVTGGPELLG